MPGREHQPATAVTEPPMFSNYFRYQGGHSGQGRTCCGLDPVTNGPKAVVPPALLLSPSFPLSSAPDVTRARTSWTITRTVAARCVHHHRASRNCFGFVLTSCAHRAPGRQGSARETLRRENPERSSRSEPQNCRYIRQQAIQRGVSGGMGCRTASARTATTYLSGDGG